MDIEQVAAVGMRNDQLRTDSISHNIANALTPGFKSTFSIPSAFSLQMPEGAGNAALAIHEPGNSLSAINPAGGAMRVTAAGDVAIEGTAWFELAGPDGSLYTRAGHLRVDQAGTLVGPQDLPIIGDSGPIHLENTPFTINAAGEVIQDGAVIDRLRRVQFDHVGRMQGKGNAVYSQGGASISESRAVDPVRSGVLEASNVNTAYEMVRLSETVRHFESLQKIVQGYDATLEQTIRKLGEF